MADDVMIKQDPANPCCTAWKDKYSKLKERCTKLEGGRNALREALAIYDKEVSKMQSEKLSLKKAIEGEKVRADNEREEKVKESALRVALESEVAGLKSEILSLKHRSVADDGGREIGELKKHLSEKDTKINELNDLVEKERKRAELEKKKAESEREKADELRKSLKGEKTRADEERRLSVVERKKAELNGSSMENFKKEVDQVKSKLKSVTLKFEDVKKHLAAEREKTSKESTRANAAVARAEDQKNTAEANHKMFKDEKSRASDLSRQLEQERQKVDNLKKEIGELRSSRKMVNIVPHDGATLGTAQISPELCSDSSLRSLLEVEQNVLIKKKHVKPEMEKVKKQRKVAEAYKKKASAEKDRADKLFEEVINYKKMVEELRKENEKLISARSFVDCPPHVHNSSMTGETAKIKLLKKELKLEKMLVKHAKKVAKFEKTRKYILQQNLLSLKQELVHFSRRLNILDGCFFQGDECDLEKICSLNLKSNHSGLKPCEMHCHFRNDMVQLAVAGSDLSKQKIECNMPSLHMCGENNPGPISGINSKLEPLLRGSNKKVLQSSAKNSSSASLSDRLLVGSQERCPSITTSAKSAEGKLDIEPTICSLFGDSRKRCNENAVAIAENNSKSPPISCISTERRASHQKKMRRSLDAIESYGNVDSEGKKRQRQLLEENSLRDCLLNSRTDGPPDERKQLVAAHLRPRKKRKISCELGLHLLNNRSVDKTNFGRSDGESDVCTHPSPTLCRFPETAKGWKDGKADDLGDFDVGCDYMKLLNLDNDVDEESYRLAIETPLSPTLPEIQCHTILALESMSSPSFEGFSNTMGTLASSGCFDVVNGEINSDRLKHHILDPSNNSPMPVKSDQVDSSKRLDIVTAGNLSCNSNEDTLETLCRSDLAPPAFEVLQISSKRRVLSLCNGLAKYCVIFSSNYEENSISSVYRATSSCYTQCSASSDPSLRSILVTLENFGEISNKEKTCVFVSLLLLYISDTVTRFFGDDWDRDLNFFVSSIAQHLYTELSHEDTRRLFVECCNFCDVLYLMEDFLLHGKLLLRAVSSDSRFATDSGIDLILDGHSISLYKQPASTQLLLTGGILLASVCTAFDHVSFACEASCNILRMLRFDALSILHIFAYICGSRYFTLEEYGLCMTLVKSVVTLLHKNNSSSVESLPKICLGSKCPFSEGADTLDVVASLLLDSLKSYACPAVGSDLVKCDGRKTKEVSDNVDLVQSAFVTSGNSCQLADVLALVELVACLTSWDWMFDKIVCPLLNLLESCSRDHFATGAAITTLLGQLGRVGVEAFGHEDVRIQRLRSSLCACLCKCDSKEMGLCFQFSIGIALIGLIPISFEELSESNIEVALAANPCDPTDCLRNWFALLSNEQRLLVKLVNSASKTSWLTEYVQG